MKKFLISLLVFITVAGTVSVCSASPQPKAASAVLASLTSQQILYSKNFEQKTAPAELTKLMSAYTVFKLYGFDTNITVPENIKEYTNYMENNMNLKPGEVLKSADIINGMLLGQANDAAYAVALNYSSIDKFVNKMNEYAKKLEMKNTHFVNPTGKSAENQYTTARDLLILYREFYNNKDLYAVLSAKNVTIPATNMSGERTYWTKNHLMSRFIYLDYVYPYANAGLSSSSSYGGYSVISSASKGDKEYVCVVLNSAYENGVNYSMTDAQELFNYGFEKFSTVTIAKQGGLLYEAKLKNHKGKDTVLLCANKTVKAQILTGDTAESVEKRVVLDEPVKAPVKKGQVVGSIVYTYQGNFVGELELVAERDVNRSIIKTVFGGIGWFFNLKAVKTILLILVCIILILFVYARYKTRRRRRRNRNRRKYYSNRRY